MRATIVGLLIATMCGPAAAQQLPQLADATVQTAVSGPGTNGLLRYGYKVSNPASSLGSVSFFAVDLGLGPGSSQLSAEGLTLDLGASSEEFITQLGRLGPPLGFGALVPVGCLAPEAWSCSLSAGEALLWSGDSFEAPIAAGGSLEGFETSSFGLPTIRDAVLEPDFVYETTNEDADEEDAALAEQALEQLRLPVKVVGPTALPEELDVVSFAADIANLRAGAEQNAWVRPGAGVSEMDELLGQVQAALQSENFATARAKAAAFIAQVESISCTSFDCPAETPVTAEARALLAINMAFLRSQLPANEPPVADARLDQVVECASAGATTVMLGVDEPIKDPAEAAVAPAVRLRAPGQVL